MIFAVELGWSFFRINQVWCLFWTTSEENLSKVSPRPELQFLQKKENSWLFKILFLA